MFWEYNEENPCIGQEQYLILDKNNSFTCTAKLIDQGE